MYKYISFSKLSNSSTWNAFYIIWGNYKLLICPLGSVKQGHGPRTATTAYKPCILITSSWMLLLAQASFVIHQASVTCLWLSGRRAVPASFHHLSMYASWHLDRVLYETSTFSEATLAAITGYRCFFPFVHLHFWCTTGKSALKCQVILCQHQRCLVIFFFMHFYPCDKLCAHLTFFSF